MGRTLCAVALVSLCLATGPLEAGTGDRYSQYLAPSSACPGADETGLTPSKTVATMACLVRYARVRDGRRPLRRSGVLDRVGSLKLADELRCGKAVDHDPCGRGWRSVFRRAGYLPARRFTIAEILAYAEGSSATPRTILATWLASPRHRSNLFSPGFREAGFAVLPARGGRLFAVEFGRRAP
jgi:uncharacterized protein YkwD